MYQGKYSSDPNTPNTPTKPKQPPTASTRLFYKIYICAVAALFVIIGIALIALNSWLHNFEASQPDTKAQQVFDTFFADPDWNKLYGEANLQNTAFEQSAAFVAYMEQKVGSNELHYIKTSAGLSGGHKYIVKLGDENLATFTLHDETSSNSDLPQWNLQKIEFFLARNQQVTVTTLPDRNVTVNGVAVNAEHIVKTTTTVAEEYLPEGIYGYRTNTYLVSGLLMPPTVSATDADGNPVNLSYDEATCTYTEVTSTQQISEEQESILLEAAKTYCRYMIGAATQAQLRKHFLSTSDIYKAIIRNEMWVLGWKGYSFGETQITDFYSYSDDLFSARLSMSTNVTRPTGTIKEYPLSNNFFIQKQEDGTWKVIAMSNKSVLDDLTQVRLQYMVDGETLRTDMVDSNAKSLTPPEVTAPEGKTFSGWFQETVDEKGNKTLTLVFAPDETGNVTIPMDYILEPMTLYALFEAKGA